MKSIILATAWIAQAAASSSTTVLYAQPGGSLDLATHVFANPTANHGKWPRFVNGTSIVFWQTHAGAALAIDTPTDADLSAQTRMPGPAVAPAQQALSAGGAATQGAQYARGTLGLYLNTTGAREALTTATIESSFMDGRKGCVPVWSGGAGDGLVVSLDLAAPTAAHCARGRADGAPCAIYSTLSLNVHSRDFQHYMWYETSLFDLDRPVLRDNILFDQSSQQPIVHGFVGTRGGPASRYNARVAGSAPAFNGTRATAQRLAWRVAAEHVERAVADVKRRFNATGLPGDARDWCVGGFNIELEGTPATSAGVRVSNLALAITRDAAHEAAGAAVLIDPGGSE